MKILFICTGNICRSPSAEAVLRKMCADANLADWTIDSAGIGNWHSGDAPDLRATKAAQSRGYSMEGISARSVRTTDYTEFNHIYAMTEEHRQFLLAHAPDDSTATIHLFLESCGLSQDVPDPYYDADDGFTIMMDLLEDGCRAILSEIGVK